MKLLRNHRKMAISGVALTVALVAGGVAYGFFSSPGSGTGSAPVATVSPLLIDQLGGTPMYNSTIDPTAYQASQCFYCVQMGEFGNQINLAGGGGPLSDVVVAMANFNNTPGTTDITLNIYNPGTGNSGPPGSLIASDKQTFNIPATSTGYDPTPTNPAAGIDNFNIVFNFASQDITLPSSVVYSIQYNDAQNSVNSGLNVQLVNESSQISVGSDANPGYLFASLASTANGDGWDATYNDVGPGEITSETVSSTFAQYSTADSGSGPNEQGEAPYIPAVEFDTNSMAGLYPGGPSQPINFSITNTGSTPATVNSVTVTVKTDGSNSLAEDVNGNDIAGCYASWFTISPSPDATSATVPAGGTVDWIGTENISMPANTANQDACEGANLGLTFTSD